MKHHIGLFLPFFLGSVKSTSDKLTVETLEQLKEMAEKHLSIDLEMIEALTQLNFKDVMYFIPWYSHHEIYRRYMK